MTTETKSVKGLFEEVFENVQKTAQANIEMQQELFRKWTAGWPGVPQPQANYVEKAKQFQKDWAKTVKELLNKHRDVFDERYQLAVDSLDEAFRVAQSSNPQEYAKRCEARHDDRSDDVGANDERHGSRIAAPVEREVTSTWGTVEDRAQPRVPSDDDQHYERGARHPEQPPPTGTDPLQATTDKNDAATSSKGPDKIAPVMNVPSAPCVQVELNPRSRRGTATRTNAIALAAST